MPLSLTRAFDRKVNLNTATRRSAGMMIYELHISWPHPDETQDNLSFTTIVGVGVPETGESIYVEIKKAEDKAYHRTIAKLEGAAYAASLETGPDDEWGFMAARDSLKRSASEFGWGR